MSQQNLSQMKTGEIAERARKAGVPNVDQMNKQEMIQAMSREGPASKQPGRGGGRGDAPQPTGISPRNWKNVPGNQS